MNSRQIEVVLEILLLVFFFVGIAAWLSSIIFLVDITDLVGENELGENLSNFGILIMIIGIPVASASAAFTLNLSNQKAQKIRRKKNEKIIFTFAEDNIKIALFLNYITLGVIVIPWIFLSIYSWLNIKNVLPIWTISSTITVILIFVFLKQLIKIKSKELGVSTEEFREISRLVDDREKEMALKSGFSYLTEWRKLRSSSVYEEVEIEVKKRTRKSISRSLRFNVLRRDNFSCIICGRSAPEVELHVDHIIPWSIVKEHVIDNLVTTCKDCNLGKSDKILSKEEIKKIKTKIRNQ